MTTENLNIAEVADGQANKSLIINEAINALENAGQRKHTITLSGDRTLTEEEFTRNVLFRFSGLLAASATVTVPRNGRLMGIDNQTGQELTIDNGFYSIGVMDDHQALVHFDENGVTQLGGAISGSTGVGNLGFGSGPPDAALGNDRDLYIDRDTGTIYRKDSGVWVAQATFTGSPGSVIHNGTGEPATSLGVEGDWYFRNSGQVYQKTSGGVWVFRFSVIGPSGIGIASFSVSGNMVTVTFTDGSTDDFDFDLPPGVSIDSVTVLADGTRRIEFSDGSTVDVPAGRGIMDVTRVGDEVCVTYDDGVIVKFPLVDGIDGQPGISRIFIWALVEAREDPVSPPDVPTAASVASGVLINVAPWVVDEPVPVEDYDPYAYVLWRSETVHQGDVDVITSADWVAPRVADLFNETNQIYFRGAKPPELADEDGFES